MFIRSFIRKAKNRIKSVAGETLVETLVAMLIVVLPFLSLAAAVMTSTRTNYQIKNENSAFLSYDDAKAADEAKGYTATYKNSEVTFDGSGGSSVTQKVSLYIIEKTTKDPMNGEEIKNSYIYFGPQEYE